MTAEVFKRILDALQGADLWIVLFFLIAGIICVIWMGKTKKGEKKVLRRQIIVALLLAGAAGGAILINHFFFQRDPVFSKNLTGILVMRMVGDEATNSLQGELVDSLNVQLEKDPEGNQIEVHAGRETIGDNAGLAAAHERARKIGQSLNARLVIWGRKIGDKKFYPRITVVNAPEAFSDISERTHDAQRIDELRLPEELVDEPFYLIHFIEAFSYYDQENYKEALPHFETALQRRGGSPIEIADLLSYGGLCAYKLGSGQKGASAKLKEAIGLFEKAAEAYQGSDRENWAVTQINLGAAYAELPTGDRSANLLKAIAALEAALSAETEKDIPAFEVALSVQTEKKLLTRWMQTQINLGAAYAEMPTGDRSANLQRAVAAFEAALRVSNEKEFRVYWIQAQYGFGVAYGQLPTGDRSANLQKAIAAFEAALRASNEKEFRAYWAVAQINLGVAYTELPTGDRSANLQKAIAAFEAAQRVKTEKEFPVDWAKTQNNLGLAYAQLPTGDRAGNLKSAEACFHAALRVFTENGFPNEHLMVAANLAIVEWQLHILTINECSKNLSERNRAPKGPQFNSPPNLRQWQHGHMSVAAKWSTH
jgi:tetratricopeptide (TPR) repeat protein